MFSIFPCFWNVPGRKPIKSLADHHFPPKTVTISRPVPEPVKAPVKIQIPVCEMCIGENNDFTEIDLMLSEMSDPSQDARARQMMQMISTINEYLGKTIKVIQNSSTAEGGVVTKEELLRLLEMFASYSHTLQNYFKETKPSLH